MSYNYWINNWSRFQKKAMHPCVCVWAMSVYLVLWCFLFERLDFVWTVSLVFWWRLCLLLDVLCSLQAIDTRTVCLRLCCLLWAPFPMLPKTEALLITSFTIVVDGPKKVRSCQRRRIRSCAGRVCCGKSFLSPSSSLVAFWLGILVRHAAKLSATSFIT